MIGTLHIGSVGMFERHDNPSTVAVAFLYGGRGGLRGTEALDREGAEIAFRDLGRELTSSMPASDLERPISDPADLPEHVKDAVEVLARYANLTAAASGDGVRDLIYELVNAKLYGR